MRAQFIAQVGEIQAGHGLELRAVRFPQRLVHQLCRRNRGPTFVKIPSGVRIAQRSQKRQFGERAIQRIHGAHEIPVEPFHVKHAAIVTLHILNPQLPLVQSAEQR